MHLLRIFVHKHDFHILLTSDRMVIDVMVCSQVGIIVEVRS